MGTQQEENKKAVRRYFNEVIRESKFDVIDEVFAPYSSVNGRRGESATNEDTKQFARGLKAAFPDWKGAITHELAEGDLVCVRVTSEGTHTGKDFKGIPAQGKHVQRAGIFILKMKDGKIDEMWDVLDHLGLLTQLGATLNTPSVDGSNRMSKEMSDFVAAQRV